LAVAAVAVMAVATTLTEALVVLVVAEKDITIPTVLVAMELLVKDITAAMALLKVLLRKVAGVVEQVALEQTQ